MQRDELHIQSLICKVNDPPKSRWIIVVGAVGAIGRLVRYYIQLSRYSHERDKAKYPKERHKNKKLNRGPRLMGRVDNGGRKACEPTCKEKVPLDRASSHDVGASDTRRRRGSIESF